MLYKPRRSLLDRTRYLNSTFDPFKAPKTVSSIETRLRSTAKKFQTLGSVSTGEQSEVKPIEKIPTLPKEETE